MFKSVITSKIQVSSCGWVTITDHRLANALNKFLGLYPGYIFRVQPAEGCQFKVRENEYKALSAAFPTYFKLLTEKGA
jgi:hypothetical protein